MAQFGNRMFGGAVPGLLGGISDMMARYPALGGGMTRPAFNKQPSGTIGAMPFDPSQAGQPTGNPQPMPPGPELLPNGGMTRPVFNKTPIDLSQAQTLPAFQQQGGPTNYPGIERPMPPAMPGGGSMTVGNEFHTGTMPKPNFQRPNRPGLDIDRSQVQNLPGGQLPPGRGQPMPLPGGSPTNYPGIERPMPPMPPMGGNSIGMSPPPSSFMPGSAAMAPGGVRPGTFYRPNLMPRDPRGRMRSM